MKAAVAPLFPTVVRRPKPAIDVSMLKVEHNIPLPGNRLGPDSKFGDLFKQLRPGSSVRCESHEMNTLAQALRKQIATGKFPEIKGCVVRSGKCPDGHCRVWAIKEKK